MAKIPLSDALRAEYQRLFDTCQIRDTKSQVVEKLANSAINNQVRYKAVGTPLKIPWYVIAVIHNMECSQSFKRHLHNGDPLTARTTHVPKGRPKTGNPPFTWEDSALDALAFDGFDLWRDWSIPGILYELEGYNGWGYRLYHPEVKSPYLWANSNHYQSGKYVSDGTWSETQVSSQCGAAVLLRRIAEMGEMDADSHVPDANLASAMQGRAALFRYAPNTVSPGGMELQRFLNQFPGIFLKEDGKLGRNTSDAYRKIFGRYLIGDPHG